MSLTPHLLANNVDRKRKKPNTQESAVLVVLFCQPLYMAPFRNPSKFALPTPTLLLFYLPRDIAGSPLPPHFMPLPPLQVLIANCFDLYVFLFSTSFAFLVVVTVSVSLSSFFACTCPPLHLRLTMLCASPRTCRSVFCYSPSLVVVLYVCLLAC